MNDPPFKFDEIGLWSELKLEIIEQYGAAYTKAFANARNLKKYYIDGFSGAGMHISKTTGSAIEGSPTRALKVMPPFDGYCFIDLNADKTDYLRATCGDRPDVDIHTGDASQYLTRQLLPTIQYEKFNRAPCLLEPYALQLDWEVILQAGQSRAVSGEPRWQLSDASALGLAKERTQRPADLLDISAWVNGGAICSAMRTALSATAIRDNHNTAENWRASWPRAALQP